MSNHPPRLPVKLDDRSHSIIAPIGTGWTVTIRRAQSPVETIEAEPPSAVHLSWRFAADGLVGFVVRGEPPCARIHRPSSPGKTCIMRETIYLGLKLSDEVAERNSRQFEAFDNSGEALGVFQSRTKAARAVFDHDIEQRAMEAPIPA